MKDIHEEHSQGKRPRDHQLVQPSSFGMTCDKCNKKWLKGTMSHRCCKCDYDECPACVGLIGQLFDQTWNGTDSENEENEGISEDGSWPDMNLNDMFPT